MRQKMSDKQNTKMSIVKSIKWTTTNAIFNAASAPIYKIILARLLLPSDFALLSIINIYLGIAQLIGNLGIAESIIQRENITNDEYSTLFFLNVFLSSSISMILLVATPYISDFYNNEQLHILLQLTCITIVVNGISNFF